MSRTRIQGKSERPYSWNTTAIFFGGPDTRLPSRRTSPSVGAIRPEMHLSSVVLPDPDGPDQAGQLPRAQVEGEVAHGLDVAAVGLVDLLQPADGEHRLPGPPCGWCQAAFSTSFWPWYQRRMLPLGPLEDE